MPDQQQCSFCRSWKPIDKDHPGEDGVGKCASFPESNGTQGKAGRKCKAFRGK